jgi:hypothetical protein
MDDDGQILSDQDARHARRARLRRMADGILDAVEDMARPKSFLEAERAARAVMAADRMMAQLYETPKPARPRHDEDDENDEPDEDDEDGHPDHPDAPSAADEAARLDYWRGVVEKKLDRLAAHQAKKTVFFAAAQDDAEDEEIEDEEIEDGDDAEAEEDDTTDDDAPQTDTPSAAQQSLNAAFPPRTGGLVGRDPHLWRISAPGPHIAPLFAPPTAPKPIDSG